MKVSALSVKAFVLMLAGLVVFASCRHRNHKTDLNRSTKVKADVEQMANSIAYDVTEQGPIAWLKYFEDSPGFFMVSDGQMVFPNYLTAQKVITGTLIKTICKINLKWANVRVEPLERERALLTAGFHEDLTDNKGKLTPCDGYFTAVAENTGKGWQLRNAHWSIKH